MTRPAPRVADVVSPSLDDPVVHAASEVIGGPPGRHLRDYGGFWTPVRVVLVLVTLVCALGYAEKAPGRDVANWHSERQYTHVFYTELVALYFSEGLNAGKVPYRDQPVEYPVLIGGVMQLAAVVARVAPPGQRAAAFFDVTALILVACALLVAWCVARLAGRRRPWDAALVALSPVLALHAFTNWDLIATAFATAALFAWSRKRPAWAGVLIGLGVATKLYPLLVLVALFLLCLRTRRWREWFVVTGSALLAWLVVDLPVWVLYPASFGRFWSLNATRPADWDSLWFLAQHDLSTTFSTHFLAVGQALLLLVGVGALAWLVLTAPQRPRLAQLLFLLLVVFLLTSKVDSPQYSIWLLPLAVLARPRWRLLLAWQLSEVLLTVTRYYFFVSVDRPGEGAPIRLFLLTVVIRDLLLVTICAFVVREIRRPERDVVRAGGTDDPAGGIFDHAADGGPLRRSPLPAGASAA